MPRESNARRAAAVRAVIDLFGNETREPRASLRPLPAPVKIDLFAYAAELAALTSGKPKSQEHAELLFPIVDSPAMFSIENAPAAGLYFVLTRRMLADRQPWRCVLITADFAEAHDVSDRFARPVPRLAPRETAIVGASALTPIERELYSAQAMAHSDG